MHFHVAARLLQVNGQQSVVVRRKFNRLVLHLHTIRIIQKRYSFTLRRLLLMCSMARWDRFTQITNNLIHLKDTFQSEFSLFPLHNNVFFKCENFLHSSHKSFHFWVQFLSGSQRFWWDSFLFFSSLESHTTNIKRMRAFEMKFFWCVLSDFGRHFRQQRVPDDTSPVEINELLHAATFRAQPPFPTYRIRMKHEFQLLTLALTLSLNAELFHTTQHHHPRTKKLWVA